MKFVVRLLSCLLVVIPTGCTKYSTRQKNLRDQGYDPWHAIACGPDALTTVLKRHGMEASLPESSRFILSRANHLENAGRDFLGTINPRGHEITWPDEMNRALINSGLGCKVYTGSSREMQALLSQLLLQKREGIMLVRKGMRYHYSAFYPDRDPSEYWAYGEETQFVKVYLIP